MKTIDIRQIHVGIILKYILTFLLSLIIVKLSAQSPEQIWRICLRPNGQSCNSIESPASCIFGMSKSNPGHEYKLNEKNNHLTESNWHSCVELATSSNITEYEFSGISFNFEVVHDTALIAGMKCFGSDTFRDFFDMTPFIKGLELPGMSFKNRNDSLVIGICDIDRTELLIKHGSNSEFVFALSDIKNYCIIEMPITWFTKEQDLEIFSVPKSDVIIRENPIRSQILRFRFLNDVTKQHLVKMEIVDLNGNVLLPISISDIQKQSEDDIQINLGDLSNQNVFLIVTTDFDARNYPFVIAK